ncbi:hypothetical protein RSAG8_08446, partial [Rhizoctonia solani AG-8 WAC10335]
SLVNCWHQQVYHGLAVEYAQKQSSGPDHKPEWVVTPKILGELNPEYRAGGPSVKEAIEKSAKLIAASKHC